MDRQTDGAFYPLSRRSSEVSRTGSVGVRSRAGGRHGLSLSPSGKKDSLRTPVSADTEFASAHATVHVRLCPVKTVIDALAGHRADEARGTMPDALTCRERVHVFPADELLMRAA